MQHVILHLNPNLLNLILLLHIVFYSTYILHIVFYSTYIYHAVCYLWVWNQLLLSLTPLLLSFTAVQTPNPKNKMSYHRNNKNRNAENASYIHVQRDALRTVSLSAPPRSRPTNRSYNKVDVNKEPKVNLCPGEAFSLYDLLMHVVCIPMESHDDPSNLHPYAIPVLFPGHHHHHHHDVLEN